jgi:hypothetical protein
MISRTSFSICLLLGQARQRLVVAAELGRGEELLAHRSRDHCPASPYQPFLAFSFP